MSEAGTVPLSRMRKAVVRTVLASAAIPQYSLEIDLPRDTLEAGRRRLRESAPEASVTDVVHVAVAAALRAHPGANSSYTEAGIVRHASVNLAFIVEVPDGMVTPVIVDAQALEPHEFVAERKRLTAAALDGSLAPAESMSGTFTVSNLGPLGVHRFTAMVLPPQAAVLALGAPAPDGVLTLTLTCDHRVLDGAPAARFLREIADNIEKGTP